MTIGRFLIRVRWVFRCGLVLAAAAAALGPARAGGTLYDETINWTGVRNASDQEAHGCRTAAYSITGPGILEVRETMDPGLGREFFNRIESSFRWTTHEGWEVIFKERRVGGRVVTEAGPRGAPFENRYEYRVPAQRYSGEIAICPPVSCNLATCDRFAALTSLRVEFDGGITAPVGGASGGAGGGAAETPSGFLGSRALVANGYGGRIEITGSGTSPTVRLYYDATGQWETMTDVRVDSASGEISFTRPWAGRPAFQKYRGRLSGGAFVGTFTDANSPGRTFGWQAGAN